jgi:folate-binding protein YgfZ
MMTNTLQTHLINKRTLTCFTQIEKELDLQPENNYLFDLSYLGVLEVQGTNAAEFLQGQLTCDLQSLTETHIVQGAQCNLQGRILALMDVINWNGVKLVLPNDLIPATIKSLNKTALLSRLSLQENNELAVLGLYVQDPLDFLPNTNSFPSEIDASTYGDHYCCYHLGQGFYMLLAKSEFAKEMLDYFSQKNQLCGSLTWHTLNLKRKRMSIYPESRGLFLPHRLDLHQTPYLSFNKGCYKGQEIIARMHYKATLKHQLAVYSLTTEESLYSGQKLFNDSTHTEIGELVDFSLLKEKEYLLAISILKDAEPTVLFEHQKQIEPYQLINRQGNELGLP